MILSVDWDFFVPENPMLDWGHAENELFLNGVVWQTRVGAASTTKTSGAELTFWEQLRGRTRLPDFGPVVVTDSHVHVCTVADSFRDDTLLLFDAHHDCWPVKRRGVIACDTWVSALLSAGVLATAVWVRPDWLKLDDAELYSSMSRQVRRKVLPLTWREWLDGDGEIEARQTASLVHVCRSGCWTPPWLDGAFQDFVTASGMPTHIPIAPPWDGWCKRWTDKDYAEALAMESRIQEQMAKLRDGKGLLA